jgi:hypothetical protein
LAITKTLVVSIQKKANLLRSKVMTLLKKTGKVIPYGVYDVGLNKGWVSVGIVQIRHNLLLIAYLPGGICKE